jgi:hypothetical protein
MFVVPFETVQCNENEARFLRVRRDAHDYLANWLIRRIAFRAAEGMDNDYGKDEKSHITHPIGRSGSATGPARRTKHPESHYGNPLC